MVINQHLLFAGMPIPQADALIIDEAHNLEAVAFQFLGFSITNSALKHLLDDIANPDTGHGLAFRLARQPEQWRRDLEAVVKKTRVEARVFFEQIRSLFGHHIAGLSPASVESAHAQIVQVQRIRRPQIVPDTLSIPLESLAKLLAQAVGRAETAEQEAELQAQANRCNEVAQRLKEFLTCASGLHGSCPVFS